MQIGKTEEKVKSKMSARERAGSALSVSSNEIDRQLEDLTARADTSEQGGGGGRVESSGDASEENVAVMVRCRPLSDRERDSVVMVDEANKCVEVAGERQFFFDQVFSADSNNERVYMRSARRLVDAAFTGFNCTIFLYGQTGTGKTYTHSSLAQATFEHLFALIQDSNKQTSFLIRASYYELYNEEIRDLLAPSSARASAQSKPGLELRESKERGVYVKDLTCFLVSNLGELVKLKKLGDKRRTTAATRMNEHSSRAHSILSLTIETTDATLQPPTSGKVKKQVLRLGRLHLIDLAGSERQSKSGASGQQLKEASRINLSLTCLSLVIRALTDKTAPGNGHVPYRNSKLTRLLSSSLGGNSKTLLIACVSPARSNLDETLNTLRFASRTKQIKNRAVINEDPKDALLRKYKRQLEELRAKLSERAQAQTSNSIGSDPANKLQNTSEQQVIQEDEQLLVKQLELLKAKIMYGGENLLDKMELHERLLAASRQELEERQNEETKLREQLASKRQSLERVSKTKGGLESQRSQLDERLRRALALYKRSKLELRDQTSEHERLREQLLTGIRATSKEIKYVECILDDFIPREQLDLINAYAQYDDESDEWQIKYIALSGNNMAQTRRLGANSSSPTLRSSTVAAQDARAADDIVVPSREKLMSESASMRPDPFIRLT